MTKTILKVPDISCEHCENDEGAIGLDRINGLLDDEGYPVQSSSTP